MIIRYIIADMTTQDIVAIGSFVILGVVSLVEIRRNRKLDEQVAEREKERGVEKNTERCKELADKKWERSKLEANLPIQIGQLFVADKKRIKYLETEIESLEKECQTDDHQPTT